MQAEQPTAATADVGEQQGQEGVQQHEAGQGEQQAAEQPATAAAAKQLAAAGAEQEGVQPNREAKEQAADESGVGS